MSIAADARWWNRTGFVGALFVAFCFTIAMMEPITNTDIGWHLEVGREILASAAIPEADFLTHTASGQPMVAHEWLAQVIYFEVTEAWGLVGLRTLHAGVVAALLLLVYGALRREGVSAGWALLALLLYAVVAQARFQIRPHMFHLLFFVVVYLGIFVARPRLNAPQLLAIGVVVAIWANIHSAALLFGVLVLLYLSVEIVSRRFGRESDAARELGEGKLARLAALAGVVWIGLLATPHHFRLLPYVLESQRVNRELSIEWLPMTHFWAQRDELGSSVEVFWLLVLLTLVSAASALRRGRSPAEVAVVLALVALPLQAQRFTAVSFAPLLFVFSELALRLPKSRALMGVRDSDWLAAGVALLVMTQAVTVPASLRDVSRGWQHSPDFRRDLFPAEGVALLREWGLEARIYHPSRWGGFISHRSQGTIRTFSDGRWVALSRDLILTSAAIEWGGPGSLERLKDYGVALLLLPRGWSRVGAAQSGEWLSVFQNFNCEILLRQSPSTAGDLRRVETYYRERGIPFDRSDGFRERLALGAEPDWARQFRIFRTHLEQFRIPAIELLRTGGRRVEGW